MLGANSSGLSCHGKDSLVWVSRATRSAAHIAFSGLSVDSGSDSDSRSCLEGRRLVAQQLQLPLFRSI